MKPKSTLRPFLALASSSLLAISSANAVDWNQTTTGTFQWDTGANWVGGAAPVSGAGAVANLSVNLTAVQTVNLATAVTLGSLTYGDSTTGFFAQTIQGSAITFDNSGAGATLTQASTSTVAPGNIGNNIILNDTLTLVNNGIHTDRNQSVQLTGVISGSSGIRIASGGTGNYFNISNSGNTYSGGFTLDAANARVVTGSNSNAFGTGTITINAGGVDLSAPSAASQAITTTNTNVWNGNWTLAGATSTGIWNNNGSVTLGGNVTVSGNANANLSLTGNIGQTGGARSLGFTAGVNTLSGTNSYTGGTSATGGTLNFINTASMPSTGNVSMGNNSTLGIGLGGNGWTSTGTGAGTLAGIFQGTNVGVGAGSATLAYTTAVGLNLITTGSHSFGAIENLGSGATAFTKSGTGSLTITGDNTYTGATTVIGGGTLVLDYTSGNVTKLNGALTLGQAGSGTSLNQGIGGGTITLKGGAQTETVTSTTLNTGGTFITRDTGTGVINLNAISVNRAVGGTISFADGTIATTDSNNFGTLGANGILGGWATVGNDWAVSANTGAADTAITALSSYTPYVTTGGVSTTNYSLSGSSSVTAATNAVGTLKITDTGAGQSLALGSNDLEITSVGAPNVGGIMYAGGTTGNYEISGTGNAGQINTSNANQELIFAVQSGNLTVSAKIGAGGAVSVTKSGTGTLILSSADNLYTGAVRVNQGVVRLAHAAAAGTSAGGITVQNGAALELSGGIAVGAETLFLTGSGVSSGGALRNLSGTNSYAGAVTLGIGGARINNDVVGNTLTLSGGLATNGAGDVTFGGVGNTTVSTVGINGGGALIKDGAGTLTLSATNTYTGATTVSNGSLLVNGNISTSVLTTVQTGATLGGSGTVGALTIDAGGFFAPGNSPGIETVNGAYTQNGTLQMEIEGLLPGNSAGNHDQVVVNGVVTLNGLLDLTTFTGTYVANDLLFILLNDSTDAITGTFTGLAQGATIGNYAGIDWQISYTGNNTAPGVGSFTGGNDVVLMAVPEPRAALLGGLGMLMLLRRKRSQLAR